MPVHKHLAVSLLVFSALGPAAARDASAQTSIGVRPAAKPKAQTPAIKAPAAKPQAPTPRATPPATFSVPPDEEENWYDFDQSPTPGPQVSPRSHQAGLIGVVNYFGSGVGAEYLYDLGLVTFGGSTLFTASTLESDSRKEAEEFFETKSWYLKAYARYRFLRYAYVGGGLGMDRLEGTYGWKGTAVNGQRIQTNFKADIPFVDVFLGSEIKGPWGLYLGIDWIGTSMKVGGASKVEDNSDVDVTSRALKGSSPRRRIDEEAKAQLQLYYLNLRVGLSF
jgi:hypothetical protein